MAPQPYNVAVIGYGLSAKVFHLPLIEAVPEFKLHAIVQRSPTPESDAGKNHSTVKIFPSTEEMVKDSAVDVIVVTTTPQTHFEICKLALEHGKHVIVEKPFTTTSEEAVRLIEIAKRNQRLLTVYHNRRFDTDFLTLSKLMKERTLGRIVEFETHFDRHRPELPAGDGWKTKPLPGGGAIYDLGTHLIDQVVASFGLPERITGFVGSQREGNTTGYEDSCTVLLHYDTQGLLATVKAGVISPEVNQLRYWVRGDKGSYKKFHLDCQEEQLRAGKKLGDAGFGIESAERAGTLTTMENGQPSSQSCPNVAPLTYAAFYGQFAKALAGNGAVPVQPEEAKDVIRLIEMARMSSQQQSTLKV